MTSVIQKARDFLAGRQSQCPQILIMDLLEHIDACALLREPRLDSATVVPGPSFDLIAHLDRQVRWSIATFGPGLRVAALLDHIRKEVAEIEAAPTDLEEWVDLMLLAFDGAWRSGHLPAEIAHAIADKQARNELRSWPDWRVADPEKAIEHIREAVDEQQQLVEAGNARSQRLLQGMR